MSKQQNNGFNQQKKVYIVWIKIDGISFPIQFRSYIKNNRIET